MLGPVGYPIVSTIAGASPEFLDRHGAFVGFGRIARTPSDRSRFRETLEASVQNWPQISSVSKASCRAPLQIVPSRPVKLFPKVPNAPARASAAEFRQLSVGELANRSSESHPTQIFAATGGNRVSTRDLSDLAARLRSAAADHGYPLARGDLGRFDAACATILFGDMTISAAEASDPRLWNFMGCVLLPDLVRWRFEGGPEGTAVERFLGGARNLRNTFGRCWWRARLLGCALSDPPTDFIDRLGEDQLVQITERTNLAGSPRLARQIADSFLEATERYGQTSRSELMRDAIKRIRRLAALASLDAVDSDVLVRIVDGGFEAAARALMATRA